jgi:protein-L-isoaspartate(D-aspartate) O-methyltransferase
VPVGERYRQTLYLMRKTKGDLKSESLRATLFVPMTGEAEAQRKVKPDPAHPQIFNGSFEETTTSTEKKEEPTGWHYQRQLTLKTDSSAPDGKRFGVFHNTEPGRGCHALQGFAIDGRSISSIELCYWVRGENIRPESPSAEWPRIIVTFYDEQRATVGEESVGKFEGTFGWKEETGRLRVPLKAREAIIRIGLLGAIGELSLDDLRLRVVKPE